IAVSTAVSLTLTPMICAHFVRKPPSPVATRLDRAVERVLGAMVRFYARSLAVVLDHRALMLLIMAATMAITTMLYVRTPKGFFPARRPGLDLWGHRGTGGGVVPGHVQPAEKGGSGGARRPRRRRCRLLHRHLGLECLGQSRQPVHQSQAGGRTRWFEFASRG